MTIRNLVYSSFRKSERGKTLQVVRLTKVSYPRTFSPAARFVISDFLFHVRIARFVHPFILICLITYKHSRGPGVCFDIHLFFLYVDP